MLDAAAEERLGLWLQARIEEIGQSLLRGARDRDTSALSIIKRRRRRSSRTQDAYEDHFLLPEDRVVVLTNRALTCLVAPGFAAVHAAAEQGRLDTTGAPDIPAAELRWAVLWKVRRQPREPQAAEQAPSSSAVKQSPSRSVLLSRNGFDSCAIGHGAHTVV